MDPEVLARAQAARTAADLAQVLRFLRCREARRRGGDELSYRRIAGRTGWSVGAVGAYFTGTRLPSPGRFERLLDLLGAEAEEREPLRNARQRVARSPVVPRRHRADAADPGPTGGLPAPAVARTLPAAPAGFIGREAELAALDAVAVHGPDAASLLATVTGMPGVGKSALAVHWAWRAASAFPDGQLYVDLHGYDAIAPLSTMDALGVLLSGLGVAPPELPTDLAGRRALYQARLRGRSVLVVLDDASDADQVRPLLPPRPGRAIVTSREALAGLDEAAAVSIALGPLAEAEAAGLLRRLIGTRVDHEPAAARALARHCGYLPLALRVAAEHVAAHGATPLAQLVAELMDIPKNLDSFAVADPRSDVRTVFSWSVRGLADPAARLFRLLGLVPGPSIDRHALAALAGRSLTEVDRLAARLVAASLLSQPATDRYALHDLVRQYAHELCHQVEPAPVRTAALARLLDHYIATTSAAASRQFPLSRWSQPSAPPPAGPAERRFADVSAAAGWLAAERENLVRACRYAARHGLPRHAVALALALRPALDGGHDHDALAVHAAALDAAERLAAPAPAAPDPPDAGHPVGAEYAVGERERAILRTAVGIASWRLGRHAAAAAALGTAFEEHVRVGNADGAALASAALGLVHDAQGRYRDAIECQRRGLTVARAAGLRVAEATQLINLGYGHIRLEQYDRAADQYRQALTILAAEGERLGEAHARAGLAACLEGLGRLDEALALAEEAVTVYRTFGQTVYRLRTTATIGSIHRRLGRPADALHRLTEALRECRELDNPRPTALILNTLGEVYVDLREPGPALASHADALALAQRIGDRWEHARALVGLGDVHAGEAGRGDLDLARGYWRQAYDLYGDPDLPAARRVQARLAR